jgi:hypothetical protein
MTGLPEPESAEAGNRHFRYADAPFPIRSDLAQAYREAWQEIARPGSWWTGVERVAIAEEVRRARTCALCRDRRAALSPFSLNGVHNADTHLPAAAIDAIHRLTTDASRLRRAWLEELHAEGLSDGHYVELLGVGVAVISIDAFHRALGLGPEPLPQPVAGDPSGYRPDGLQEGGAWLPMLPIRAARGPEADLYDGLPIAPNVAAAMSLVPDAVRLMKSLSRVMYLPMRDVGNAAAEGERAISRAQIELVAGRVSALNECFY